MRHFDMPVLDESMSKYGWVITGVPGLALYTVGLTDKFGHPELAIQGLPTMMADGVLRAAVELVVDGKKLRAGSRYDGVIQKYPVELIAVHPSNYRDWFGMASKYYGKELKMLQILWPEKGGRYPGDPGGGPTGALRFDVRQPGYDSAPIEHGLDCACCGKKT